MKSFYVLFIISFFMQPEISVAQKDSATNYFWLADKALDLYQQKKYDASAAFNERAFQLAVKQYKGYGNYRYEAGYNSACAWALAGERQKALKLLHFLAKSGRLTDLQLISQDQDLVSLHGTPDWAGILQQVQHNKERQTEKLDTTIYHQILKVRAADQNNRLKLDALRRKGQYGSEEEKELVRQIRHQDSLDQDFVFHLLDTRGWVGPEEVGEMGVQTEFLVVQHADLQHQQRYLPMMREAAKKGKALSKDLAFLEDRVALREGREQIYGSQLWTDKATNKVYVQPVVDPVHLDERRQTVWLEPMSHYLAPFGSAWDPQAYQQELPLIKAKMSGK